MLKKTVFAALAAAAVLCMAVPAAAETFTTEDGVLSMELPDENWKQMPDPVRWVSISDGANLITIDHYSNGETLPSMTVADDHYVNVYQAVVSTQNEVFIITGSVVDAAKIGDVCNAIVSCKVLKYDTKLAVKKSSPVSASQFSVVFLDQMMYATAGVNVRASCSTDSQILGAIEEGGSVKVTGKVQKDGQDFGWYQVSFGTGTGYISAGFLTGGEGSSPAGTASSGKDAPGTVSAGDPSKWNTASGKGLQYTGEAKTIYEIDGNPVTVYKVMSGDWYDKEGHKYIRTTDYEFAAENGSRLSVNRPQTDSGNKPLTDGFTAYWANGNGTHLTPYSDGYYYSSEWVRYSDNGNGSYSGADGTTLYDYDPVSGTPEDSYESDHSSPYPVSGGFTAYWPNSNGTHLTPYSDGYYYSSEGVRYSDNGNGSYSGTDGTTLYDYDPISGDPSDSYEGDDSYFYSPEDGIYVYEDDEDDDY